MTWTDVAKIAGLLVVGFVLARLLSAALGRVLQTRMGEGQANTFRRIALYALYALVAVSVLRQLGIDLTVLLGAAGILTVAVGFASQTAASNLISGLFLLVERPFVVGDVVRIGQTTGEVIAIDLLSSKIRTFDNLKVRVPNEQLLKSEIINLTHFPIRRIDLLVGVAYDSDLEQVREVMMGVAAKHPLLLDEPTPLFIFVAFGDSAINLQFSVWAARVNFLEAKTALHIELKKAFDAAGIVIPFPQRTVSVLGGGPALPVAVQDQRADAAPTPPAADPPAG
jgi:small-conductance mechanosensitive channel